MLITLLDGLYPDFVGKRSLFVGTATGPSSYNQNGDAVSLNLSPFYIDILFDVQTVSGTYFLRARPANTGVRQSWTYHWYVTATSAEVTNAVNLSAEKIQPGGIGGQF